MATIDVNSYEAYEDLGKSDMYYSMVYNML